MKKKIIFLSFSGICLFLLFLPSNAGFNESMVWHKTTLAGDPVYASNIVPYYPEGILYADTVARNVGYPNPLDQDLVLRLIPDGSVPPSAQLNESIWAVVESINSNIPQDNLNTITITCVEVFHGKIYVGISATDGYSNSDGTTGTDDTFRRRMYVSESVGAGEGVSRSFNAASLAGAVLSIEGVTAGTPHASGNPLPKPTRIRLRVRSAATEAGLAGAAFVGPDGTAGTYFELPEDAAQTAYNVAFPAGHAWCQYKVYLSTSDGRVTPVLQKVELAANGRIIASDDDWSGGQLTSVNNLFTQHSPGEGVLANRKLADGKTSMVMVIQPPCVQPPDWCYYLIGGGQAGDRAFKYDLWPYEALGDMEPYKGNLYLLVGPTISFHTGCRAGDLVRYDYAGGLFTVEGHMYQGGDPNNPSVKTFWGEGGGRFRIMGDILVMPEGDSKIGSWNGQSFVGGESTEWYLYTTGNGQWKVGYTTPVVETQLPMHIWDIAYFQGYEFIHTNRGVVYRPLPTTEAGHLATSTWLFFGNGPPASDAMCVSVGAFAVHDNRLFTGYVVDKYGINKLRVFDENLNLILEKDAPLWGGLVGGLRGYFKYQGKLLGSYDKYLFYASQSLAPPLNFMGQQYLNRSLSQAQYIDILHWQENPANVFVTKYRVYKVEGQTQTLIYEVSRDMTHEDYVYELWQRGVKGGTDHKYAVVAVDEDTEGEPATTTVQSISPKKGTKQEDASFEKHGRLS